MSVRIEHTTLGAQVRISPLPLKEGPLMEGACVYCARAKEGVPPYLCRGATTNCEQRVWLASRRLRGER